MARRPAPTKPGVAHLGPERRARRGGRGAFWTDLERHRPEPTGTDSLVLAKVVVTAWKERLAVIVSPDGSTRPRADFGES